MAPLVKTAIDLACSPLARLLVALVVTVGLVLLLIRGQQVPDAYWTLAGAVVGFYFGGNVGAS